MPWLPFYASENDLPTLLLHLNASEEIAFVVSNGPGKWIAVKALESLKDGRYCLWHVPSGPLPLFRGAKEAPGEITNPFAGWSEEKAGADPTKPYFGAGHPGVFWLNVRCLAAERLLAPLDMRNTAIALTPEMKEHLAQGYTASRQPSPSPIWTFSALAGAGAFNSNAEDMMRFVRANIEDSSSMSRTLKKMHTPQFDGDTGIGWMQPAFLDRFFGNKTVVWHNGMVGGYASYVSVDTKTKTGIVVLSNKAVDVTMLGMMLTRQARTQSWSSQHAF
ncbi:MAG: beta-lactamase family protein [Gammaproteobacteria bacterium]|nr:beta-lactamase family protein [Gammaproteobacteria bacterium]